MSEEQEEKIRYTKGGRRVYDLGKPYVPERDYASIGYKPLGKPKEHFCIQCKNYYCDLAKSGLLNDPNDGETIEFPPQCEGDPVIKLQRMMDEGILSEDDSEYLVYLDPVAFCIAEFDVTPRWYQVELLRCTARKKVVRAGRRLGKSFAMAVKIAHLLYTQKNWSILVICPYQSQVKRVFDIIRNDLMDKSATFRQSVERDNTSAPQVIELSNGSKVTGFSSGAKSGGKATQVRGQDAHAIFLDEMDYLSSEDFESLLAILASYPECLLWASSTPTGARSEFFKYSVDKIHGFKEFHYLSSESPSWTLENERFFKNMYAEAGYNREFLAEFGDETAGVFKSSDVNKSIVDYQYSECSPHRLGRYVMGVDWNDTSGVHIVVVELLSYKGSPKYKLVNKTIIPKQEFTQLKAVQSIIDISAHWNCEHIYVDAGYGQTQVEMLKSYGLRNPKTGLHKKVKSYTMQSNMEIRDPQTGEMIKKPAKAFMVNVAQRQVEENRCILPKCEDTDVNMNEEEGMGGEVGLVQQMRHFKIEKYSATKMPIFSQGFEHTLTAWMLAITGFVLEMSDMRTFNTDVSVRFISKEGEATEATKANGLSSEDIKAKKKKVKESIAPKSRQISNGMFHSASHNVKASLQGDRMQRDSQSKNVFKSFKAPKRMGRSTF